MQFITPMLWECMLLYIYTVPPPILAMYLLHPGHQMLKYHICYQKNGMEGEGKDGGAKEELSVLLETYN
jgi:hypothetical protein